MPIYTTRGVGIYRCRFIGTDERDMVNPETQTEEPRWIWKFQELKDPTSAGQIDKITTTSMKSANSNAYKMAAGVLGHPPVDGDDTDTHINDVYDVVYGPNQAGNLTITQVIAVVGDSVNPAVAGPVPTPGPIAVGATDDLPF